MIEVECIWFRQRAAGQDVQAAYCAPDNTDGDLDDVGNTDTAADHAAYLAEILLARAANAATRS